ncbi:hypothetical protein [Rhizobium sp. SSA_523]|uniref:hypothetical protein n=1 Tax=Rhizobium sp. SSA_523 TaxID=2952477 RepID=UPI002090FA05|nr:hypothetical protein [Rhizobium sp. SSA_523]MCO5732878.1 hypothetical protein [Rhizobium sp. SSA_523]WKC23505.1 hypothetical protein QTJ18_22360 [Rhizobium sp. SSA_523]
MKLLVAAILGLSSLSASSAFASEEQFLKSIEGRWTGGGLVLRELGGQKVNVTCNMQSKANASRFSMDGSCRALVVISRGFNANVTAKGTRYSGTYVGVSGKPSRLVGSRRGDTISFDVTWANQVYGDRKAIMEIRKVGENGLQISTIDKDPKSGKTIVTTQLRLKKS